MSLPPLSPTNDFVFKKLFAEHTEILTDLLMSVLDFPPGDYQGLVVVDPHLRREAIEDKEAVLDVKIRLRDGKDIDVEIQVRTQPALWKRMQYYNADMYVKQIRKGNDYHLLTRAIGILITDFALLAGSAPHHSFRLYDVPNRTPYPDSNEIHILEIAKRRPDDTSALGHWLAFLAARTQEEFMAASAQRPAVAQAYGILKTLSEDEETRLLAESREKGRRDAADRLEGALREGRREGELVGRREGERRGEIKGRREVALRLLASGLPAETVAGFTGLSLSEIQSLVEA